MSAPRVRFLTIALPLYLLGAPVAKCASFDCTRATTPDERAVCADPHLSGLDDSLGKAYAEARAKTNQDDFKALKTSARGILNDRRACGANTSCLVATYAGGIVTYQDFGSSVPIPSWVDALAMIDHVPTEGTSLPGRRGECVTTRVATISARLDGEPPGSFESGTAVAFGNGGHQVSYSKEGAVIASVPGDQVIMCLINIPRGCPPGDNRGRDYTVTNLRTKGTWTLPDSEHQCGGA